MALHVFAYDLLITQSHASFLIKSGYTMVHIKAQYICVSTLMWAMYLGRAVDTAFVYLIKKL